MTEIRLTGPRLIALRALALNRRCLSATWTDADRGQISRQIARTLADAGLITHDPLTAADSPAWVLTPAGGEWARAHHLDPVWVQPDEGQEAS